MEVKTTKNYEILTYMKQNRGMESKKSQAHILQLAESIEKYGFLEPILVNSDLEVIDGQHRLEAAKLVDSEVSYIVIDTDDDRIMAKLNSHQMNWKIEDYLHYFATKDYEDYKKVVEFSEENELPVSISYALMKGRRGSAGGKLNREFKSGNLKFNGVTLSWATEVVQNIQEIRNFSETYKSFNRSSRFLSALVVVVGHQDYDHEKMMNKLGKMRLRLVQCASRTEYVKLLQDIYNHGNKKHFVDFLN